MANVTPEQLAAELTKTLAEYGKLARDDVQEIIESVGNEAKERVTAASPGRKYRRGWKVKIETAGSKTSVTVHNRRYQLTHLLEFGHKTRLKHGKYGKKAFAAAMPHIEEVNDWAQRELERRIRKALGG